MEDQASGAMHVDPGTRDHVYTRAEVETLVAMTAAPAVRYALTHGCYRPRYLNIQRLNYLWTIRHRPARMAGNLIT